MRVGIVPGLVHAIFLGVMAGGVAMNIGINEINAGKESIAVNEKAMWAGSLATLVIGGLRLADFRRLAEPRELAAAVAGGITGGIVAVEAVAAAIRIITEKAIAEGRISVTEGTVATTIVEEGSVVVGIGVVVTIIGASAVASAIRGFFQRRFT